MKLATAFLALLLPLIPQALPDGKELLKQSGDAFNKFHSYQYEWEIAVGTPTGTNPVKMTSTYSCAAINPDRRRVENKASGIGFEMLTVADGEYTWTYLPMFSQYTKKAALQDPQSTPSSLGMLGLQDFFIPAKTTGEEAVEINGKKFDCWLVESKVDKLSMPQLLGMEVRDAVARFWIAKDLRISLQVTMSGKVSIKGMPVPMETPAPMEMQEKMTMLSLRIDPDLPDSLFRFTPPEGSREVAEFPAPSIGARPASGVTKPDLAGKPAPAFHIQSLDGKTYDLAQLKGKVVLLDFWTTWCGPCRKEMPELDKLQQEYGSDDLILLGFAVSEDRSLVESYLKEAKVTHAVALTNNTDIAAAYKISAFPTYIVIGRDGVVVDTQVGSEGAETLRSLLAKAGLKSREGKSQTQ
jgi:thiol-disulfide isomerase/thioredoxin